MPVMCLSFPICWPLLVSNWSANDVMTRSRGPGLESNPVLCAQYSMRYTLCNTITITIKDMKMSCIGINAIL